MAADEIRTTLNEKLALMEEASRKRDAELSEALEQKKKMKDDFKYNLKLLQERDAELEESERQNFVLQQRVVAADAELSNLSVQLDEAREKLLQETHLKARLREHLEAELETKQRELDFLRHDKELEVGRIRDEHRALSHQNELDALKLKAALEAQKKELLGLCEQRLRDVKADCQTQLGEMEKTVMAAKMREDMLDKETSSLEAARKRLLAELEASQATIQRLEKDKKESELRQESEAAVLRSEKERLEELLKALKARAQAEVKRLEDKAADLEAELAARRQDGESVHAEVSQLSQKLREKDLELEEAASRFQTELKRKDSVIAEHRSQLAILTQKLEDSVKLLEPKDAEVQRLKSRLAEAREEAAQLSRDIDWYKQEVAAGARKDAELQGLRDQLEAEFAVRAEEMDRLHYRKSEALIRDLTQARDAAVNRARELEQMLSQKQDFVQSLLRDREAALEALKVHGEDLEPQLEVKGDGARVQELEKQNETLRAVIKQMRAEVEGLQASTSPRPSAAVPPSLEKAELLAQCRKAQARVQRAEGQLQAASEEKRAALTECEQLRYDLASKERHHAAEAAGLRRRLQELEGQLEDARVEADEFCKASIAQGKTVEQLQEQLEALKAARSDGAPEVNFGAQELYIQQLRDEIQRLTHRTAEPSDGDPRLLAKLRLAASQIKKLAQEKQVLVELSNRLQSELRSKKGSHSGPQKESSAYLRQPFAYAEGSKRLVKDAVGDLNSKLAQLERIQYQVTREALSAREARPEVRERPVKDSPPDPTLKQSLVVSSLGGESVRDIWRLLDDAQDSTVAPSEPETLAVLGHPVKPVKKS